MMFLLQNKTLIVSAILVLALLGSIVYIKILKSELSAAEADRKILSVQLEVSNASIKSLSISIDEQNAAVEKLKTAADERTLRFLDEIAAAKSASNTYKRQAADLLKRSAPQNISKCDAANQLLVEEITNAK